MSYPHQAVACSDHQASIFELIAAERKRQDALFGAQRDMAYTFPGGRPGDVETAIGAALLPRANHAQDTVGLRAKMGTLSWDLIAVEELAEAVEECNDPAAMRIELIQTAAVIVAWIESLDQQEGNG